MSERREIDKAIAHLMDWAERPEWEEEQDEIYAGNIGDAADFLDMEVHDLLSLLVEYGMIHMLVGFNFEDLATRRFPPDGRNLIEDFLKRRGWREGVRGRRYLRELKESVISLYEIKSVVPGNYCDVVDLVRGGNPIRVFEKAATSSLAQWDRIGARVLKGNGKHTFSGAVLPYSHKSSELLLRILLETRDNIRATLQKIEVTPELGDELGTSVESDLLHHTSKAFSQIWLGDVVEQVSAPAPQLCNKDGDSLVMAETRFEFEKVHRKKIESILDSSDQWQRHDDRDPNWAWLPKGGEDHEIIHGFLELHGNELRLITNSTSRYEKGSALLSEMLGNLIGSPLTSLQSPQQMLEELGDGGLSTSPSAGPDIDSPELAQAMSSFLDQHYREVLDDEVPALGGKTPRQCVRTSQGKKKVIEWLKYLENQESRKANRDGGTAYDFSWMWEELGLKKPN